MPLIKHLSSIISISKELEEEINKMTIKKTFAKGEAIINCFERCDRILLL